MPDPNQVLAASRRSLERLPFVLVPLLEGLEPLTWRTRPAEGRWAPVEVVCHLRDEETEDFGARVRAVVEGQTSFAPIDPVRWVTDRRYLEDDPQLCLADLLARRRTSLLFLATVSPERLERSIERPGLGSLSGLDLLVAWAAHDLLHLRQIAGTLARIEARRWAPLRADYAGTIP